jgi:sterol 3beta-glucosyltransferase
MLDDDEEESWTFVGGDPDTIDDLSVEAAMKRTVPDLGAVLGGSDSWRVELSWFLGGDFSEGGREPAWWVSG